MVPEVLLVRKARLAAPVRAEKAMPTRLHRNSGRNFERAPRRHHRVEATSPVPLHPKLPLARALVQKPAIPLQISRLLAFIKPIPFRARQGRHPLTIWLEPRKTSLIPLHPRLVNQARSPILQSLIVLFILMIKEIRKMNDVVARNVLRVRAQRTKI